MLTLHVPSHFCKLSKSGKELVRSSITPDHKPHSTYPDQTRDAALFKTLYPSGGHGTVTILRLVRALSVMSATIKLSAT